MRHYLIPRPTCLGMRHHHHDLIPRPTCSGMRHHHHDLIPRSTDWEWTPTHHGGSSDVITAFLALVCCPLVVVVPTVWLFFQLVVALRETLFTDNTPGRGSGVGKGRKEREGRRSGGWKGEWSKIRGEEQKEECIGRQAENTSTGTLI